MRVDVFNRIMAAQTSRRSMLKGMAGTGAVAALAGTGIGGFARSSAAEDNVRAEILKIPGVGVGSPMDSDWQKVGAMCLGPAKEHVSEGEFEGH